MGRGHNQMVVCYFVSICHRIGCRSLRLTGVSLVYDWSDSEDEEMAEEGEGGTPAPRQYAGKKWEKQAKNVVDFGSQALWTYMLGPGITNEKLKAVLVFQHLCFGPKGNVSALVNMCHVYHALVGKGSFSTKDLSEDATDNLDLFGIITFLKQKKGDLVSEAAALIRNTSVDYTIFGSMAAFWLPLLALCTFSDCYLEGLSVCWEVGFVSEPNCVDLVDWAAAHYQGTTFFRAGMCISF